MTFKYAVDYQAVAGDLAPEDIEVIEALTMKDVVDLLNGVINVKVKGYYLYPYLYGESRFPADDEVWFEINETPREWEYDADGEGREELNADEVITFTKVHLWNIEI